MNLFPLALIAQTLCTAVFIVHRFFKPLGSNLMYGVYIISFIVGSYLLWQSFRNPSVEGVQKTLGIVLGILPFLGLIWLIYFVSNFKMH
jgi:TRAP-type C4-dicarboxylate transport system permease small subunit